MSKPQLRVDEWMGGWVDEWMGGWVGVWFMQGETAVLMGMGNFCLNPGFQA
ncbi:MAG: hypothetical protein HC769_17245 [Cyanobacteria bacterium CRU_2_1]|nr:hypothetical protein [Cyanobacteria bacterium RU_5_0]NJR60417.1 hypothetical protein [Cyanobacteria bacterium CRU_2_1]